MNATKNKIDRSAIRLSDDEQTNYWCQKFKCSKNALMKAVFNIGNSPNMVELFLQVNKA
jgi:Protein of unknown function (DUF3606)